MSEDNFKRKIEPLCHIIPNVYAITGASYLLGGQYFNSVGFMCWINAVPPTCIDDPDVECIRGGEMVYKYRYWFLGYSLYPIFAIITINMLLIVFSVFMQNKKSDQWRFGSSGASDSGGRCFPCRRSKENGGTTCAVVKERDLENPQQCNLAPLADCLQSVKSPKESISLTSRPGTTHKSHDLVATYGAEDEVAEVTAFAPSTVLVVPRRKSAAASRGGTAEDPYAFDLQKVRVKLKEESRRLSVSGIHTNRTVSFPVDVTPLAAMSARPKPGKFDSPLTDGATVASAEGRGRFLAEEIDPSTHASRRRTVGRSDRREVVIQGSLYIGAFFFTWIWPAVIE